MKRNITSLLTAGMIGTLALGGGMAWAGSKDDQAEIALFQKAAQDAGAAIKAAETATGGKAVAAEFDDQNGAGQWQVETVTGTKRAEVRIDATTGQVVNTKDKGDVADEDDAVTPDMLGGALSDLVAKAEAAGGGKVMSIDLDDDDGQTHAIDVEIVKADGTVQDFYLSAADGKLTPAPTGQHGDHDK